MTDSDAGANTVGAGDGDDVDNGDGARRRRPSSPETPRRPVADDPHGVGKPTSMQVRENSERWGFVFERLGLDPV